MKSELVITYMATCECYDKLTEIFAQHGEYECSLCDCKATRKETHTYELKPRYAVGPEPGNFTHGPFITKGEVLAVTPGGNNRLICSIDYNGYTVLYYCKDNKWVKY